MKKEYEFNKNKYGSKPSHAFEDVLAQYLKKVTAKLKNTREVMARTPKSKK